MDTMRQDWLIKELRLVAVTSMPGHQGKMFEERFWKIRPFSFGAIDDMYTSGRNGSIL